MVVAINFTSIYTRIAASVDHIKSLVIITGITASVGIGLSAPSQLVPSQSTRPPSQFIPNSQLVPNSQLDHPSQLVPSHSTKYFPATIFLVFVVMHDYF